MGSTDEKTSIIVAEAAEECWNIQNGKYPEVEQFHAIIKAYIEKAYEAGYVEGATDGVLNERESQGKHASEHFPNRQIGEPWDKPAHASERCLCVGEARYGCPIHDRG